MVIKFYDKEKIFMIQTKSSTYAFSVEDKVLTHLYWGKSVYELCDLPKVEDLSKRYTVPSVFVPKDDFQEYRGWGGFSFIEPDL